MRTSLDDVIAKSRALLAAVDFDNNGNVVGMARMGGNGGLLSLDTTKAADALRLAFDRLEGQPSDTGRMNWLVAQYVEVRTPLVYGSRALFVAQQLSDEEDEHHRTDLRERVDAAMRGGK